MEKQIHWLTEMDGIACNAEADYDDQDAYSLDDVDVTCTNCLDQKRPAVHAKLLVGKSEPPKPPPAPITAAERDANIHIEESIKWSIVSLIESGYDLEEIQEVVDSAIEYAEEQSRHA